MNKYKNLIVSLETQKVGTMKCFGNSMLPILTNPSVCDYQVEDEYEVDDIVFCKVKGRYIDAHKITQISADKRYMISNNKGRNNGWTRTVYARVVQSRNKDGDVVYTAKPRRIKVETDE